MKQFVNVLTSYDILGVKILGIVSDCGGGNENFFRKMANDLPMKGPQTDVNSVRFVNPVDPIRQVYFWLCGTHSLKALRNNIFHSQPKYAHNITNDNVHFEWKDEDIIYERQRVVRWQLKVEDRRE